MTQNKKLKQAIRARAREQGLSYSQARQNMTAEPAPSAEKCRVPGCEVDAAVEVFLHDEYVDGVVFHEQDYTCPYLCAAHRQENEERAQGARRPRGTVRYPYSNQDVALGWTAYREL